MRETPNRGPEPQHAERRRTPLVRLAQNYTACPGMSPADLTPQPGDLILRTRPGLNTHTGRLETRYWIDIIGGQRSGIGFAQYAEAIAAARLRAAP